MLSLTSRADITRALADPALDVDLRALIGLRAWQLCVLQGRQHAPPFRLHVVQGGDTPDVINQALGFEITGDQAEEPSYKWIEDHGLWFELFYDRDDGPTRILVENGPGTELGIHYMCLAQFWTDADERGA